jgi:hypothetical protein
VHQALPRARVETHHGVSLEILESEAGSAQPVDVAVGPILQKRLTNLNDPSDLLSAISVVTSPARWLLNDIYLHRSLASLMPNTGAYAYGAPGKVSGHPDRRWFDRLPASFWPSPLGRGLANAHSPIWARHRDLVQALFARAGLDPDEFVGLRYQIEYPIWSTRYVVSFDRP